MPYLSDPAAVVILPGAREALARLRAVATKLFLFTNQSGVARGLFTMTDVEAVNQRMNELLGLGADLFAGMCIAPEHPDEPPRYRKPSPRFIHEMLDRYRLDARAAWMVGDSPVDWEAGINAGISVAAVVSNPAVAHANARREALGVPAYPSLLAWSDDVLG